jgi:hypothetical protein
MHGHTVIGLHWRIFALNQECGHGSGAQQRELLDNPDVGSAEPNGSAFLEIADCRKLDINSTPLRPSASNWTKQDHGEQEGPSFQLRASWPRGEAAIAGVHEKGGQSPGFRS